MENYNHLSVYQGDRKVGTLATGDLHLIYFEYDKEWLNDGYAISPFSLPLRKEVFAPKAYDPFDGLFGVFSDSLPDGWGRLLVDRLLRKEGINPTKVDALNRLAIVGNTGMGALTYHPEHSFPVNIEQMQLDEIAVSCEEMFRTNDTDNLDELFRMGGSSGGARPKVFYKINDEDWIVKFPSSVDQDEIGVQEYEYSLCAKRCGIDMPETKLLDSKISGGYFAVKRFDREGTKRIHMLSVSGMLETSHRIPNLDYDILMQLALKLTRNYDEVERLFRLMCFNVFAHNRDDHSRNFSFLYDDKNWKLSPAYDLTYSNSIGGEHATTVNGNGKNPGIKDILAVADHIGFDNGKAKNIAKEIQEIVCQELGKWL